MFTDLWNCIILCHQRIASNKNPIHGSRRLETGLTFLASRLQGESRIRHVKSSHSLNHISTPKSILVLSPDKWSDISPRSFHLTNGLIFHPGPFTWQVFWYFTLVLSPEKWSDISFRSFHLTSGLTFHSGPFTLTGGLIFHLRPFFLTNVLIPHPSPFTLTSGLIFQSGPFIWQVAWYFTLVLLR